MTIAVGRERAALQAHLQALRYGRVGSVEAPPAPRRAPKPPRYSLADLKRMALSSPPHVAPHGSAWR